MLYLIFALLTDYDIQVEQRTAKGRIDIVLDYISAATPSPSVSAPEERRKSVRRRRNVA